MAPRFSGNPFFFSLIALLCFGIVLTGCLLFKTFFFQNIDIGEVFDETSLKDSLPPAPQMKDASELVFSFVFPRGEVLKSLDIIGPKFALIAQIAWRKARMDLSNDEMEIVGKVEGGQVSLGAISAFTFAKTRKSRKIKAVF